MYGHAPKWLQGLRQMSQTEILAISREYSALSTQFPFDWLQWKGEGSRIISKNGEEAIDFTSGISWYNLGQHHPELEHTINLFGLNRYSDFPDHDWPHGMAALLKRELAQRTPGNFPKKVFLARTGTETNEHALKITLDHVVRALSLKGDGPVFAFEDSALVSHRGAFHGRTFGSLRLNHSKPIHWRDFVDPADKAYPLVFPEAGSDHDCAYYRRDIQSLRVGNGGLGRKPLAFFFEPIQGEGGINVPCGSCLNFLVNLFREMGAVIVADEVQTGMMRTGKMFACEHFDIVPDVICLAKSLSPGHHLGAVVYRADLDFEKPGRNSNTGASGRACAVALTMLELLDKLDKTELELKVNKLSTLAPEGLGMMRRVQCRTTEIRDKIVEEAIYQKPTGLLLLGAGKKNVRFLPPLNISDEDLELGMKIFKEVSEKCS